MRSPLWPLVLRFSTQELRHHPWRNAVALVAVGLGVALAFSVHLINRSALDEFSGAARALAGQADLQLLPAAGGGATTLDEAWLTRLRAQPEVQLASPVLEISTFAWTTAPDAAARPGRIAVRVLGLDLLQAAQIAPQLQPVLDPPVRVDALLAPDSVLLNPAAQAALGRQSVQLQQGQHGLPVRVVGSVGAPGGALALMDIGAAQDQFGDLGQLSRIDLRLRPGSDVQAFSTRMLGGAAASVRLERPAATLERMDTLSRAYRVNLLVLALVALFTGSFLVYSVVALGVARRSQQFALLGVLGLGPREGLQLVLLEAGLLGLVGSGLGLALGTALAALALHWLGGDLGGGYFSDAAPTLQWHALDALAYGSAGVLMALAGAWAPARRVQHLPLAATLKGQGLAPGRALPLAAGVGLLFAGVLLAQLPALWGVPVAAYVSVAALLLGGILLLPWLIGQALQRFAFAVQAQALPMLALERARRVRESAAVAVNGVVAALSLAVALTVMVTSFRQSVTDMLDSLLPAALYVRTSHGGSANETVFLEPQWVQAASHLPGVARSATSRSIPLVLRADLPSATLLARPLHDPQTGALNLPLLGPALTPPPGQIAVYVSESFADLYDAHPGQNLLQLTHWLAQVAHGPKPAEVTFFIAGIWRDYARQFGTVALDSADYLRLSGDSRVSEMALWPAPQVEVAALEQDLRALDAGTAAPSLEIGSAQEIRRVSLRLFDRSFAVTYWLQAVAIGIGLFGVAASFSAQVLARRKEFGLLVHLGCTRRQILQLVALEGLVWTALGALAGVLLGLAVALVLVRVVNPQSFHWTMDLSIPYVRLAALAGVVVASGTLTAWLAGRAAADPNTTLAVREDW